MLAIGWCAAGKPTLAAEWSQRLELPGYQMGQLKWKHGWVESSKDEIRGKLAEITASENWLIDGTYGGALAERLAHADTVVYLDFPMRLCVTRLL